MVPIVQDPLSIRIQGLHVVELVVNKLQKAITNRKPGYYSVDAIVAQVYIDTHVH